MNKPLSLTYIVPKLFAQGDEHFSAIPHLLSLIAKEVDLRVIAQRGDTGVEIPGAAYISVLRHPNRALRLLALLLEVKKSWHAGSRVYFVRVSQFAAIIVGLWCGLRGGELYYWHSGAVTYHPLRSWRDFRDWLRSGLPLRLAFALCNRLVTGPSSMTNFYSSHFGVRPEKIVILPNDVDVSRFSPVMAKERAQIRQNLGLPPGRVAAILHRLSPIRRLTYYFPEILRAICNTPHCYLLVVGDGPDRRQLERIVEKSSAKDRVFMIGSVPHARVHEYMRAADLFLNPSFVEGFPRVVIEAMACGLPALVTDAGGSADLIPRSYAGLVVPREDAKQFGVRLERLLSLSSVELEVIGSAMARHAAIFSTENVAREYMRVLFAGPEKAHRQ